MCNGTFEEEFRKLCEEMVCHSTVLLCTVELYAEIFPLNYLDKIELNELNGIDLSFQLSLIVTYETRSKLTNLPNLGDFDFDCDFHSLCY